MQKDRTDFLYGMRVFGPSRSWNNQGIQVENAQQTQNLRTVNELQEPTKELIQSCTFTKDQYDQILRMLQQGSTNMTGDETNAANCAGKALFVFEDSEIWIIDTGSTNQMVSRLDMLLKDSIVQCKEPKKVFLPNGEVSKSTYVGSCGLSARSLITNVFHIPNFKYNLLSVSKLTKKLRCSITFFPHFCVFQELYNGKVKEIGKEHGGLNLLLKNLSITDEQ